MKGRVNGRGKVLQFQTKAGEGQPRVVVVPPPEEVRNLARETAREDVAEVAKVLGEKIAMIYVEEVKSAVLLNSLIGLLVEKGLFTKAEFQEIVKKREAATQERYVRASEAIKKGQDPAPIILEEEKQEGG